MSQLSSCSSKVLISSGNLIYHIFEPYHKVRLKKRPHITLPKDTNTPELLTIICKSLQHSASPKPFSFPPQLLKKEKDSVKIVLKVSPVYKIFKSMRLPGIRC